MSPRRTVLHVTTTATSLELLLGPQLLAFLEAGWNVETASAWGPEVHRLEEWGIRHHALRHATRAMAPWRDAAALCELYRLFRRQSPDVVHTHNPKPGVYGRVAARAARVPVVVNTVHGLYAQPSDPWQKKLAVYSLEAVAGRLSHAELVQNVEDVPVLRRLGVPDRRLTVLGNGVDLTRFNPSAVDPEEVRRFRQECGVPHDHLLACTVGRLVWEKGLREVFAAASSLREAGVPLTWVLIGDPDLDKTDSVTGDDRARAERAGARFLGFRSDMPVVYGASDLFVTGSYREGFPRAAMEAAAMGLPVVATDIRGCRQVVDDGVTGLLVPVRDASALGEAVTRLARLNPGEREQMGSAARRKAVAEFDQRRVIATTLDAYKDLLAGISRA